MNLQAVKFKNFKSYPDVETVVDLSFDGIKLLLGPNGAGKSTFFDAIVWAIYGKNKDGVDGVINRKTKKNCKVEVCFKISNSNYSIIRYRKHDTNGNKLLFFKNNKNISQRTTGATQELIDNTIQISYNTMISSIVLSSELYTSFLRSSRSDRLKTIESILSLRSITDYYTKLRKLKGPIDEKVTDVENEKRKAEVSISTLQESVEEYKSNTKELLLGLKAKKEKLQEDVFDLTKKIAEYDKIDVDKEITARKTYELITEKNNKLKIRKIEEGASKQNITDLTNQYNDILDEIKKLEEIDIQTNLEENRKYEEETKTNEKIKAAVNKLLLLKVETSETKKSIAEKKRQKNKIDDEIELTSANIDVCPVCGSVGQEEKIKEFIKVKQASSDSLSSTITELAEATVKIDKKNEDIDAAILKIKKKIVQVFTPKYEEDYLIELDDTIKVKKHKSLMLNKDIINGENNNREINKRVEGIDAEIKNNSEGIEEPSYHMVFLKDLKERIEIIKDEAEEKRMEIEKIDVEARSSYNKEYIDTIAVNIEALKKELTKIKKKHNKAVDDQNHYEALLTIFSNKESGFKKFFINKMIGVFNDRVNFYLPFFFDEQIDIQFDKELLDKIIVDGEEVSFTSFSSGQKTRFDLAVSFSLFMMVKTFFPSTINLLVFDEILDMNLDKKGFNSVKEIIDNLGENNTVFVVSHQDYLKEKFQHSIKIGMDHNKFSYIVGED